MCRKGAWALYVFLRGKYMNKEYRIARIIIASMSIIGWVIALINEDISIKLLCIPLFTGVAYLVCLIGTAISRKIIVIGDKITSKFLKALYYIGLLLCLIIIAFLLYLIFSTIGMNGSLGTAIMMIIIMITFIVALFVPYVQALLVLLIKRKKTLHRFCLHKGHRRQ